MDLLQDILLTFALPLGLGFIIFSSAMSLSDWWKRI